MGRIAAAAVVVCLLGGTAAAFAVTEGLKTTKSPVAGTRVSVDGVDDTGLFSPVCRCAKDTVQVRFRLRKSDRLTLSIVDRAGHAVRVLVDGRRTPAGLHAYRWNGLTDTGALVPDGDYRARVELDDADRVLTLPNRLSVDTSPPRIRLVRARIAGRSLIVHYRLSEPARGLLYVGSTRVVRTRFFRPVDTMLVGVSTLRARGVGGVVSVAAEDRAGNLSRRWVTRLRIGPGKV